MELEHVGIAVRDAPSALLLMEALIGERPYKSETLDSEGVRTYFLRAGGTKLELLEALDLESPISRHIGTRGPGLHHLAFEVDNLEAVQERLTEAGFTILGAPHPGADGKRIFFVHPRDTEGVLYEFCRQSQSVLKNSAESMGGHRLNTRHAGRRGPKSLVIGDIPIDVEMLARYLEQGTRMTVVDELSDISALLDALNLEAVHLIVSSAYLSKLVAVDESDPPDEPVQSVDADESAGELEGSAEVDRISSVDARISSLIVLIEEPSDLFFVDRPTLLAARPPAAAAAAAVYERSPGADLAVGDEDLLARAIQTHIRRFERA